jgi:undecaprenyl diphosphate synthase
MRLFVQYLEGEMKGLSTAGVHLKVIGDVDGFVPDLRQRIEDAVTATAANQLITLCIAANYGGRWDVLNAVKGWLAANPCAAVTNLTEDVLASYLSTADLPEVDLMIRTGGEQRLSNFFLWQGAYSELYFTDTLWPDFGVGEFSEALDWYAKRTRRFGRTAEQVAGDGAA